MSDLVYRLDEIKRVAVLGGGTMGAGIAQSAAQAGFEVALFDVDAAGLARARERIAKNLDEGVSRGKVESSARDAALARIRLVSTMTDAVSGVHVVVEAVPEDRELKLDLYRKIMPLADDRTLIATNTSSLSIGELSKEFPRGFRARFLGLHFFNPVHIMKLCEVIHHEGTAREALDHAVEFVTRLGKTPVVVRDAPGFASSRLGLIIGLEAMRMVEDQVASVADIDAAMKLGYGHPMGPLELSDWVGLDVRLAIADYLSTMLGERFTPPAILREKVAAGQLGRKSGRGFYEWRDGKRVD